MNRCFLLLLVLALAAPARAASVRVYFGTSSGSTSTGIYVSTLDTDSGALTAPALAATTTSPTFLAFSPDGSKLYATVSQTTGMVRGWSVDAGTGALTLLNDQPTGSESPTFVKVDATGRTLFTCSYNSAKISSFPLATNGTISAAVSTITHTGSSIDPRQTSPHPHSIAPGPQNKWVYVPDLGTDKIVQYDFNAATSVITPTNAATLPGGYGPRHMSFHPNAQWAYLVDEIANKVTLLDYNATTGALTPRAHYQTNSPGSVTTDTGSEVRITPNGKFVYVASRGDNTIAAFTVNSADGALTRVENEPAQVTTPRHINLDPEGKWLLVAGQGSNNITEFSINQTTGALTYTGTSHALGRPMCVMFAPPPPTSGAKVWQAYADARR